MRLDGGLALAALYHGALTVILLAHWIFAPWPAALSATALAALAWLAGGQAGAWVDDSRDAEAWRDDD